MTQGEQEALEIAIDGRERSRTMTVDSQAQDANHGGPLNTTGMEELVKLTRTQTALMERLLANIEKKAEEDAALPSSMNAKGCSREILDILRRIDERQTASGKYTYFYLS